MLNFYRSLDHLTLSVIVSARCQNPLQDTLMKALAILLLLTTPRLR
jgi:hypothetical protein